MLARGQGQLAHTSSSTTALPAQQLPVQQRAKGKGSVPMGTESADISKLKKERSSKLRAQQDAVDMAEGDLCCLSPLLGSKVRYL